MSSDQGGLQKEQDARFMGIALKQAELAVSKGQRPFGAVVVDHEGRFVGEGHNMVWADLDPTAHAEIVAIRHAWRRVGSWQNLARATLYSSCEPCLLCSCVITRIGFRRVVFAARGTDVPIHKPLFGAHLTEAAAWVNAQRDWPSLEVLGDFMRDRALELITTFPWSQRRGENMRRGCSTQ